MKSGSLLSTVRTSAWNLSTGCPDSRLAWVMRTLPSAAAGSAGDLFGTRKDSRAVADEETASIDTSRPAVRTSSPAARNRCDGRWWRGEEPRGGTGKSSCLEGDRGAQCADWCANPTSHISHMQRVRMNYIPVIAGVS